MDLLLRRLHDRLSRIQHITDKVVFDTLKAIVSYTVEFKKRRLETLVQTALTDNRLTSSKVYIMAHRQTYYKGTI